MADFHKVGATGEYLVAHYLTKHGYTIVETNMRCPYGEIDIIASKKNIYACVEVKSRVDIYFDISTVITGAKQRKIIKSAYMYISQHAIEDAIIRFDVALVHTSTQDITYIADAFTDTEYSYV
jgi:putative endonuclease